MISKCIEDDEVLSRIPPTKHKQTQNSSTTVGAIAIYNI